MVCFAALFLERIVVHVYYECIVEGVVVLVHGIVKGEVNAHLESGTVIGEGSEDSDKAERAE